VHYGMTKTAQIAVARGIAESVTGTGVTVNSILAGPTESEGGWRVPGKMTPLPLFQKLHFMANCSTRGPLSALMTSSEPNPCRGTK
jgi:NAD(P)-dependent dehydrogenase (short-subunit alcohol dehydrogenase family)